MFCFSLAAACCLCIRPVVARVALFPSMATALPALLSIRASRQTTLTRERLIRHSEVTTMRATRQTRCWIPQARRDPRDAALRDQPQNTRRQRHLPLQHHHHPLQLLRLHPRLAQLATPSPLPPLPPNLVANPPQPPPLRCRLPSPLPLPLPPLLRHRHPSLALRASRR